MSSEQPLKSVYRSASISLRKADLARQNEDQDEELYQLNQFAKTVRLTLQTHRLWERRKDDKDAVELVAKLPGTDARVRELGGTPYTPPDAAPPPRSDSAPSVLEAAATKLQSGQASAAARGAAASRAATRGALLRRSRANSRANSRAASPEREPQAAHAPAPARPPPHHHHPPRQSASTRVPVKDDDDDAPGSPSSAEKYGMRVQIEVARLFEEAEAVRIAALERKVEMMRARMDATSGAAHGVSGGLSPTKAARGFAEMSAGSMEPTRTLLPSASVSVAAAIVSSGGVGIAPPSGGFADRLESIDAEVTRLRKHIADAAAATGTVTGTSFVQRLDDVEREVRETRRASLDKSAYVVAPEFPRSSIEPAATTPGADAPGAWIRRGETEMSATPRAPAGGPTMAAGSSWLVKQLSPGTARPASSLSTPPAPAPQPLPAAAVPVGAPRVTLPPAPDIPVPASKPSPPAPKPVATVPDSEKKFKAPAREEKPGKKEKKDRSAPAPVPAPSPLPEPVPPTTLPAPPEDLNAVAAAAASRAIESSLSSSPGSLGGVSSSPAGGPGGANAVLATMDGAKAAAVAAAEAAATAVSERVRRELRFVAERQDALTRRGEAEFNAVVAQVLPLHEETNSLRTSMSQLEARVDSVAEHVASTDGVNMAASAAAVAAAAGAEVEALRAHVAKQQKASQDWTESAIAHYGKQAWDHTQRVLLERDQSEQERVKHLHAQLEEAHRWQREFQKDVAEKFVQQESVVDAVRRQMMQMAAAMEDMQGELAQQGGQKQSQMNMIMQRLGALESATGPRPPGLPAAAEAGPVAPAPEPGASTSAPVSSDAAARLEHLEARLATAEDLLGQTAMASAKATTPIAQAVGDIVPEIHSLRERLAKMEELDYGKSLNDLYDRISTLEAMGAREIPAVAPQTNALAGVDTSELEARIIRAESSAAAAAATEVQILKEKIGEFGMRLSRAEEVATEAAEAATTTSPGTAATKKAVPGLRARVAEMEVEVAARLSDVESRIADLAESCVETAALAAATPAPTRRTLSGSVRGSPRRPTPSPARKSPVPPESHASERITEERQVTLHELALDAVAEVEDRLAGKIAEVEAKMFDLSGGAGGGLSDERGDRVCVPGGCAGVPEEPRGADTRGAEAATTTSPGTAATKKAVPGLRARVAEMEVEVAARLSDVESRIADLAESCVETAALAAATPAPTRRTLSGSVRGSPRRPTPSPARKSPVPPESHASERITEERQVTLHELALDAVAEVEDRLAGKIAEVEAKMFDLSGGAGGGLSDERGDRVCVPGGCAGVPEEPRGADTRGTVPSDTGRVVVRFKGRARRGQGAPPGAQRFVRPGRDDVAGPRRGQRDPRQARRGARVAAAGIIGGFTRQL